MTKLRAFLPFLNWFPMSGQTLRADAIAGFTVTLVLIPQSMAYAMLAGLPVVYGLYAALLPVVIGSLFGNFKLLHTGPVAMLSLMSAAAIAPLALVGSELFVELSIMLALMIGVLRLAMGAFKLGAIVNLVSHPVIVGFTGAAALIIGLSQLRFVLNMPSPATGSFAGDLWGLLARLENAHGEAVAFGIGTALLIWALQRFAPRFPAVMAAVVIGTAVSAGMGFERSQKVEPGAIMDAATQAQIKELADIRKEHKQRTSDMADRNVELRKAETAGATGSELARIQADVDVMRVQVDALRKQGGELNMAIHGTSLVKADTSRGAVFYREGQVPPGVTASPEIWRFQNLKDGKATVAAGGAVIGKIPAGLPAFKAPSLHWDLIWALFPAAFVMALIGFMEATAISRALATKTRERIDTSKELVGQGLANIAGSFFQSYAVAGSFSRSAVGARAGARTGLFAVISVLGVVATLLFLTQYLYHLPQAVLAAIVMMAVFGLIRVKPLIHAWNVQRSDAIAGLVTFVATLALAPRIENGILLGIALSVVIFLLRTMKPRVEVVGIKADGTVGGVKTHGLEPVGENFVAVRFDRSLNFLNVAAFEDSVLEVLTRYPQVKGILVIGSGINEMDASGEDKVRELTLRLRESSVELMFSSLKAPIEKTFRRSGLSELLGHDNLFVSKAAALSAARHRFDLPPKIDMMIIERGVQ